MAYAYYDDDVLCICSQVPDELLYFVIDELPEDRLFRSAWEIAGESLVTNLTKAKEIAQGMRRVKRMEEFAPHDDIIKLAIPGQDGVAAEAARATIRARDSARQIAIDVCTDEAGLRALIMEEGL